MRWWLLLLLVAAVVGKKKHRHQKPGRALLDRLISTTVGEVLAPSEGLGLLPPPLDVAPYAAVAANATCGEAGAEEFCRDTPGKRGVVCDVCSGLDGPPSRRHPPSHAVDGDPSTWWQSPTLATGDFSHVNFEVTLPAAFAYCNGLPNNMPLFATYNFTQMANALGLPCEEHHVTTEDGYILTMFRIPGSVSNTIFGMHGIVDSSDTFIVRGNTSMAFYLAGLGYEQWYGNQRGTQYSQDHVTMDPEKDAETFWNFSIEELALIDLRTMIDYALKVTGQETLTGIGHSQGSALFLALCSELPEYNDVVDLMIALAPVGYFHNVQGFNKPTFQIFPVIKFVFDNFKHYRLIPAELSSLLRVVCAIDGIGYDLCVRGFIFPIFGFDEEELEPEFFQILNGHFPVSPSVKNFHHLTQIAMNERFAKYDYGKEGNLKEYGSLQPPEFPLNEVTTPVALIAAKNDFLSNLKDVQRLADELPNVAKFHIMERELFNHADHVWGKNMPEYLFPLLQELLKK